jgi:uncharacterized protein (TIGR02145 family)
MKKLSGFWTLSLIVMGLLVMANKCEKDPEEEEIPTITDIDGNEYKIVELGTKWWMAENLKVTRYNNGDLIGTTNPATLDLFHTVYDGGTPPKYQWAYNGVESNAVVYGRLYTWYAVTDPRGVCPAGWHIPSNDEWLLLQNYLIANGFNYDGTTTENKIAKAMAALTSWNSSAYEGSAGNTDYPGKRNASGFSGLAAGIRFADGEFAGLGESANWFTSTNYYDDYDGIFWGFGFYNTSWGLSAGTNDSEEDALSVRCVKN